MLGAPPLLSVLCVMQTGAKPLFDDLRGEKGMHLRWVFRSDLGFPAGGFSIFRGVRKDVWKPAGLINLPVSPRDALQRILTNREYAPLLEERYGEVAVGLVALLAVLTDPSAGLPMHLLPLPSADAGAEDAATGPRLRALDAVLLSSVDPYVARMIGLYWIDEAPGLAPYGYRVVGHWGAREWPMSLVALPRPSAAELRRGDFRAGEVRIASRRAMQYVSADEDDINGPYLLLTGDEELALRIVFPRPVAVAELEIGAFRDTGWSESSGAVVEQEGARVIVRAPPDRALARLDLRGPEGPWRFWRLTYRERLGSIGDVEAIGIEKRESPLRAPRVTKHEISAVPPALGAEGRVPATSSRVALSGLALATPEDSSTAVRWHIGRSEAFATDGLVGFWSLQDSARDSVSKQDGVLFGAARFAERSSSDDTLPGSSALRLDGSGACLLLPYEKAWNRLGEAFSLESWVSLAGAGSDGFPAIFGNDFTVSYWFGVEGGARILRFYLNGARADSSLALDLNRWHHVAVTYDGTLLRFYVDGRADDPIQFAHGPMRPNTAQPLCLGADRAVAGSDRRRYGFEGELAYAGIWKRVLNAAEVRRRFERRPETTLTWSHPEGPAPVVYRPTHFEAVLPELLALWRFDGDTREAKSQQASTIRGWIGFDRSHSRQGGSYVLSLRGNGFVEMRDRVRAQAIGAGFTLQAWVCPRATGRRQTIVAAGRSASWWLGIEPDRNRLAVSLNGVEFQSVRALTAGQWVRVTATYDGRELRVYLDGGLEVASVAALGPINPNASGSICIGADADSTADEPMLPLTGDLADVRIWLAPLHPDEAETRMAGAQHRFPSEVHHADLVAAWPGLLELSGEDFVEVRDRSELQSLGTALTLRAWICPHADLSFPTIIGNDHRQSFWLGLETTSYRLRFWLNGTTFHSVGSVRAHRWTHVTVTYDGARVRFYLEGRLDSSHPAALDRIRSNPANTIVVGAESGSIADRIDYPFAGRLADVTVWRAVLSPAEAITQSSPAQYWDHGVPDGRYAYQVQSIDLFGRVSPWSEARTITVRDTTPPPPPVNVRARYLPLRGQVIGTSDVSAADSSLTLETTIAWHGANAGVHRHDALVSRERSEAPESSRALHQTFEIQTASAGADGLSLRVTVPSFAQLTPRSGDAIAVDLDSNVEVRWAWTGWQRLHSPLVESFEIHAIPGPSNVLGGTVQSAPGAAERDWRIGTDITVDAPVDALAGQACQVGQHRYRIVGHGTGAAAEFRLRYLTVPTAAPRVGESIRINVAPGSPLYVDVRAPAAWGAPLDTIPLNGDTRIERADSSPAERVPADDLAAMRASGIVWLPDEGSANAVYRLRLGAVDVPQRFRTSTPDGFVPGALVAFVAAPESPHDWQALLVLWQTWSDGEGLTLYFSRPSDIGREIPDEVGISRARYHPGESYAAVVEILPAFGTRGGVAEYAVGVTAVARGGMRSALAPPATVVAVDRRRPAEPSRPHVHVDRADYHGRSRASVTWDAPPEGATVSYQVYRATESAIFTRDLEQRRSRTGPYAGRDPSAVFAHDRDFSDWLAARSAREHPAQPLDAQSFFPATDPGSATPLWRAWFEHFYPTLTAAEMRDLAALRGNETAFTLVGTTPVGMTAYDDVVDGRSTNRYLWGVRSMSPTLQPSTEMSNPSDPTSPPKAAPPRAPTVTKIEGGDRSITLRWALNHERDLEHYRIYRAGDASDLQDLRWWAATPDPRRIAILADPRLKVSGRAVGLPAELPINEILGVYRADELDVSRFVIGEQMTALNHYDPADTGSAWSAARIATLRRMADGTPVIVVYRATDGQVRILDRASSESFPVTAYDGAVRLSAHLPIDQVLGVYRAVDVVSVDALLTAPTSAPNYCTPETRRRGGASQHVVEPLSPLPDGTPVVVLYRDTAGATRVVDREWLEDACYVDRDVVSPANLHYRVVAVDDAGNVSTGSSIVAGRGYSRRPPPEPLWDRAETVEVGTGPVVELAWWVSEPGLHCLAQRQTDEEVGWHALTNEWQTEPHDDDQAGDSRWYFRATDTAATRSATYRYRVLVRNGWGQLNQSIPTTIVTPGDR